MTDMPPPGQQAQPGWGLPPQPPKPPGKPFYKRAWFWILTVVGIFGLLFAACLGAVGTAVNEAANTPAPADNGISRGAGSKDATKDVTRIRVSEPDAIGIRTINLTITNHSSEPSDYYIELALEDAEGNNVGMTNATADRIKPGQNAYVKAVFTEDNVNKVVVTEVSRTASN